VLGRQPEAEPADIVLRLLGSGVSAMILATAADVLWVKRYRSLSATHQAKSGVIRKPT
jgi:hypothetical protein